MSGPLSPVKRGFAVIFISRPVVGVARLKSDYRYFKSGYKTFIFCLYFFQRMVNYSKFRRINVMKYRIFFYKSSILSFRILIL
jgi:hypothetical protein